MSHIKIKILKEKNLKDYHFLTLSQTF